MRFVPKEKLGKKAKRALERTQRVTWGFSPATRKAGNPKAYSRKKPPQEGDDPFGGGIFLRRTYPEISMRRAKAVAPGGRPALQC